MTVTHAWKWDDLTPRKRLAALAAVVAAFVIAPVAAHADEQPPLEWRPVDIVYIEQTDTVVEVGANPNDLVVDGWTWDGT
jgi:hypothetical protein